MDEKPFLIFIKALLPKWGDAMTGRLTAPFVILAAIAASLGLFGVTLSESSIFNRAILASPILAVSICGLIAVYNMWKKNTKRI